MWKEGKRRDKLQGRLNAYFNTQNNVCNCNVTVHTRLDFIDKHEMFTTGKSTRETNKEKRINGQFSIGKEVTAGDPQESGLKSTLTQNYSG